MILVGVAEVKARLSHYLRAVRGGQTVTITDHAAAVAQIVPVRERHVLRVRMPAASIRLGDLPRPEPLNAQIDVLPLLLEERAERP